MRIRRASVDDAADIASVQVASWRGAYRGQLPDEVLDGLDVGRRTEGWLRYLAEDGQVTVVAEDGDGRITGFAYVSASRDDDADPGTGEVIAIYTLPETWGTGTGGELMAAAVEALRSAGFRTATLWVLDGNERSRRFYERAGWVPDGARMDGLLSGVTVHEVRYRRPL